MKEKLENRVRNSTTPVSDSLLVELMNHLNIKTIPKKIKINGMKGRQPEKKWS